MARGRKPIEISKESLTALIAEVEDSQNFNSRNALWVAIADTEKAKAIGLSSQVAMLRANQWGIEPKTPKGQRGRVKGQVMPATGQRQRKRIALPVVNLLKQSFDKSLHGKINRAAKGSVKAAIALKCIDCSGGSKKEVAHCTVQGCPLWSFRPYKVRKEKLAIAHTDSVTMSDLGLEQ